MPHTPTPSVHWRSHLSLALLALVYIFSYIDRQVISILIEPIKRDFGATDTQMGLLTGLVFGLLYALLSLPLGRMADTGNRRNIIAVCCSLWSLATMACGMAGQFWHLLVARMSVAIGEAGGMAPSISLVSDLYPKERRSLAISLFMLGPHFGVLIGLALGGWVAQTYGWRATFITFGVPGVLLGLLVWLLVREPQRGAFEAPTAVSTQPNAESLFKQVKRLLGIAALRRVGLACGVAGVAGYGYGIWTPSFLVRTHGLSLAEAGLLFGLASGLGAMSGGFFSGWLADRLCVRDTRWQIALPGLGVLICIPLGLAFFFWPPGDYWIVAGTHVPHAMVFAAGFGFFASWWPSLSYSAISQMVSASERSVAAAILNLFITVLGVGAGPLVTGLVSDLLTPRFGDEALRWALVCVLSMLVFTVFFFARSINPYRERITLVHGSASSTQR